MSEKTHYKWLGMDEIRWKKTYESHFIKILDTAFKEQEEVPTRVSNKRSVTELTNKQRAALPFAKRIRGSSVKFGFPLFEMDDRPGWFVESRQQRELLIPVDRHFQAFIPNTKIVLWLDEVIDADALFEIAEMIDDPRDWKYDGKTRRMLEDKIFQWS